MADVDAHRPLNILVPDLGPTIGSRQHQVDSFRAVALTQRRRHPTGVANRGQLLVGNQNDLGRHLERIERRGVGARHVEHRDPSRVAGKVQQGADARGIEDTCHRLAGRTEQLEPRLGLDDQAAEERLVETLHVLERVHHRKARLFAKKHRRVAKRNVQVDEQRGIGGGFANSRCDVDRDGGRADATLGADEGVHLAARSRGQRAHQPLDRRRQLGNGDRMRHDFVDASAHRVEHQRRIELRRRRAEAGRRVLALEDGDRGRKLLTGRAGRARAPRAVALQAAQGVPSASRATTTHCIPVSRNCCASCASELTSLRTGDTFTP